MKSVSNIRLGIGIPLNHQHLPSSFFDSFIMMDKPEYVYLRSSMGAIEDMRNNLVREAFLSRCTHVIMMDTDQIYHPKTIPTLLSRKLPIVGCLVYRRYPPFDPLMFTGEIGKWKSVEEWGKDALVEVDATGTGCLMIETEVFKNLPEPWFKVRVAESGGIVGEDFHFCADARAAGYKIYVDTSVPCGHLSTMVVNEGTWKLYRRLKEVEAAHDIEHGVVKTKDI